MNTSSGRNSTSATMENIAFSYQNSLRRSTVKIMMTLTTAAILVADGPGFVFTNLQPHLGIEVRKNRKISSDFDTNSEEILARQEELAKQVIVAEAQIEQSIGLRLENTMRHFGLSIAKTADLLGLTRPSLYAWIKGLEKPLRHENQLRFERLERLSERWATLSQNKPGLLMRTRKVNGKTLEEWLTEFSSSDEDVFTAMKSIAHVLNSITPQEKEKIALEDSVLSVGTFS